MPTNEWVIFLLGGFGKEVFTGFWLYFTYVHWQKAKAKAKEVKTL